MLPVSSDYLGGNVEVRNVSSGALLTAGKIIKIDHEALELAASRDGFMPLLQYRMPVKLYVTAPKASLERVVLFAVVYLSTENFLRVEDVKTLEDFERRGAFRVMTASPGKLYPLLNERQREQYEVRIRSMYPKEADQLLAQQYLNVRVMDVSLTGVRIASRLPLSALERYRVEFTPLEQEMSFNLRLQRLIHMPDGAEHYGCSFYDTAQYQIDALLRDLFQIQRLERSRQQTRLEI